MAFKPNYRHERAERNRVKEQKKQEKLLRRQENAARRKTAEDEPIAESEAPKSTSLDTVENQNGAQQETDR
jgi:hypothetical protein